MKNKAEYYEEIKDESISRHMLLDEPLYELAEHYQEIDETEIDDVR